MSLLSRLFGTRRDTGAEQIHGLAPTVDAAVVTLYTVVADQFPELRRLSPTDWDFFAAVGAIYFAVDALPERKRTPETHKSLRNALENWDRQALLALKDCGSFVQNARSGADPTISRMDAVGMWVLWNLYGRAPTYDEAVPARAIGGILYETVRDWWV